jgi:hypothetical protein
MGRIAGLLLAAVLITTACNREKPRSAPEPRRDDSAARAVGRGAYKAAEEAGQAAKKAGKEIGKGLKEASEGWKEAQRESKSKKPKK